MVMTGNTILITGASTGIGLALARRLFSIGNTVIICGRNRDKLKAAARDNPGLHTYVCDVAQTAERLTLYETVVRDFPALNVLFNNAGLMRFPQLDSVEPWSTTSAEIATNLEAPIHLAMLFAGHLSGRPNPVILNTTSGLSHVPLAVAPIYSATKAALHSFSLSLRQQLKDKAIQVIEVSPPQVQTDLGGSGHAKGGMDLAEYADSVMWDLEKGETEITVGFSRTSAQATRPERDELFRMLNSRAS